MTADPNSTPTPWVLIPCSGAKRPEPLLPAAERYTGRFHRLARAAADALTRPERIRIVSARYGLLALDDLTEPYDARVDRLDPNAAHALRQQIGRSAHAMLYAEPSTPVVALLPSAYVRAVADAFPTLVTPLAGSRGIGHMQHRLAVIRDTAHLPATWYPEGV